MIEGIRLGNTQILQNIRLLSLGKINVICGRNSSGKTSILRQIESGTNNDFAFKLTESKIEIFEQSWNNESFKRSIGVQGIMRRVDDFFNSFVSVPKVFQQMTSQDQFFFANELPQFLSLFVNTAIELRNNTEPNQLGFNEIAFLNHPTNLSNLKAELSIIFDSAFQSFFSKFERKAIYISPKRKLNQVSKMAPNLRVTGDGLYLLEKLFAIKSSLSGSHERILYEKIYEKFAEVSEIFKFDVVLKQNEQDIGLQLYFSPISEEKWIPAEASGLGLQDILVIIFFSLSGSFSDFILIEEPENHLHPDMQRRLLRFLKEETPNYTQFLLSTHSNVFLDDNYVDQIFFSKFVDGTVIVENASSKSELLSDLGYAVLDNLVSDLIIIVEGSSDKAVLIHLLTEMGLLPKFRITFWILGGDAMNSIELEPFAETFKIIAMLDLDTKCERKYFHQECKNNKVEVFTLERYSIENYIPLEVYKNAIQSISTNVSNLNHKAPIWGQLGHNIKKSDIKKGVKKFIRHVSLDELQGTDLLKFLKKIRYLLRQQRSK